MDIEALIKNLEAVNDSLQSPILRESDDFKKCVERFQVKLADLIGVYKLSNSENTTDLKKIISDLKTILEEIETLSSHDSKVLDFAKDIVPIK
jgi:predicted FMN-binding regulatory protein PaiB